MASLPVMTYNEPNQLNKFEIFGYGDAVKHCVTMF